MTKQKRLYLTVLLSWSLTTNLYASNFWDYRDIKQFPIQQNIVETITQTWIKPSEMTSWGIGKSYVYYYPNLSSMFSRNEPKFSFRPTHIYELKRDFPFGKSNTSFGMDITLFEDFLEGKISNNGQFSDFRGFDILGNYKFKKSISTRMGDIIGIMMPKFGIAGIIKGLDKKNKIYYPITFGIATGVGLGIDYYPSQWLGVFIECSLKWNRMISWLSPPLEDARDPWTGYKYQKKSYSYYPVAITFGFKTTF